VQTKLKKMRLYPPLLSLSKYSCSNPYIPSYSPILILPFFSWKIFENKYDLIGNNPLSDKIIIYLEGY